MVSVNSLPLVSKGNKRTQRPERSIITSNTITAAVWWQPLTNPTATRGHTMPPILPIAVVIPTPVALTLVGYTYKIARYEGPKTVNWGTKYISLPNPCTYMFQNFNSTFFNDFKLRGHQIESQTLKLRAWILKHWLHWTTKHRRCSLFIGIYKGVWKHWEPNYFGQICTYLGGINTGNNEGCGNKHASSKQEGCGQHLTMMGD